MFLRKVRKVLPRCSRCGGEACICFHEILWAAHCQDCNNSVDYSPNGEVVAACTTEAEAERLWSEMNDCRRSN